MHINPYYSNFMSPVPPFHPHVLLYIGEFLRSSHISFVPHVYLLSCFESVRKLGVMGTEFVIFKFRVAKWKHCAPNSLYFWHPSNSIKVVHNSYCASNTALLSGLEMKRCNQRVICTFYTLYCLHTFRCQCVVQNRM